jgi:hypothetical protein
MYLGESKIIIEFSLRVTTIMNEIRSLCHKSGGDRYRGEALAFFL